MKRYCLVSSFVFLGFIAFPGLLPAQTLRNIDGVGYQVTNATPFSPGQVITLFIRGLCLSGAVTASGTPLPPTLNGISVTVVDQRNGVTDFSGNLPLFSMVPIACDGLRCTGPDLSAVTVQMPTEIPQCSVGSFNPCLAPPPFPVATINKNGQAIAQMQFVQVTENIHLLNSCDSIFAPASVTCNPLVTHADGSLVTSAAPAHAGETVVAYATGIAQSGTRGVPAPRSGLPDAIDGFQVEFDFRADINPTAASAAQPNTGIRPVYAGLVGGLVGVHQINVLLPTQLPSTLGSCGAGSNMGLNIGVGSSYSGVRLCVSP
jgi:uncharacterized protein (TIGR03437 family)